MQTIYFLAMSESSSSSESEREQEQVEVPELSNQQLKQLVLTLQREREQDRREFQHFKHFVGHRMVPLEEKVLATKKYSNRERAAEVERATKRYTALGDKRTVGFLVDLHLDISEREEAFKDLASIRRIDRETGEPGPINWDKRENREKISNFIDLISEDIVRAKRKVTDLLDQYAIARDSQQGWKTVQQFKKSKTFDHFGDAQSSWEEKPLTHEEKDEKYRKAEKDAFHASKNSGGKAKGVGSRGPSGSSSAYGRKVELV